MIRPAALGIVFRLPFLSSKAKFVIHQLGPFPSGTNPRTIAIRAAHVIEAVSVCWISSDRRGPRVSIIAKNMVPTLFRKLIRSGLIK